MRRGPFIGAAITAALLWPAVAAAAPGHWAKPKVLCYLADARITEASGIVVSRRNPHLFCVHNDSGDSARFFAVSRDGSTRFTVRVRNATNVDWEDIAAARDHGKPVVFLADIGDNTKSRKSVTVYEAPDPAAPRKAGATVTVMARAIRFRYPDGPHDAETLLAEPDASMLYVVTKVRDAGPAAVFRIDPSAKGLQTATRIGQIRFSDPLPVYPDMATGGDIAADRSRLVVRTYQCAYEWTVGRGETLEHVFQRAPVRTLLVLEKQGEAICYGLGGRTLYTTSEQRPTPVYEYKWEAGASDGS